MKGEGTSGTKLFPAGFKLLPCHPSTSMLPDSYSPPQLLVIFWVSAQMLFLSDIPPSKSAPQLCSL